MKTILILGAFDRYNYGDLLFPYMIKHQMEAYQADVEIKYFGLIESDLTEVGGLKTEDIHSFYEYCNGKYGRVNIFIAGGEAILVPWDSLLVSINKNFGKIYSIFRKLKGFVDFNLIAKKIVKGRTTLPYGIVKEDFSSVDSVIYNSLGGSSVNENRIKKFKDVLDRFKLVDYFSVRDTDTYNKLKAHKLDVHLYPDSAILMSKFYPKESTLKDLVSQQILEYVDKYKDRYVFFQSNKGSSAGNEKVIAQSLDLIGKEFNQRVCLCPIGKALAHDDQIGLRHIKDLLKVQADFLEDVTIWDIMYLIANSSCYIGTSLHGAITAMSFDRPYIGVRIKKLNTYLQTWGVKEMNSVVQFNEIPKAFRITRDVSSDKLVKSRMKQFDEIEKSFDKMYPIVFGN